ncbi:hypothetical protein LIER_19609 [Lithospermum erythrorhizon]|uniref:Nucleotide-diphospho-sugar transferase domain-containing protein n=1 Tax=Lithospermum erythrorhizon TaxID=34254 RepID=A0AAV3QM58_LITER
MDSPRGRGGGGGYREDVRLLGGGGGTYQSSRNQHHMINNSNQNFFTKNILVFSLVALSCLVFYHSASPIQYVFNVAYNPLPLESNDQAIDTFVSSQDLLSTKENLPSTTKISYDDQNDLAQSNIAKEDLPSSMKDRISGRNQQSSSSSSFSDSDNPIDKKQSFPTHDNVRDQNSINSLYQPSNPKDDGNESFSSTFADSNEAKSLRDPSSSSSFDLTSGNLPNTSTSSNGDLEQSTWNASSLSHDQDPFWTKDIDNITSSIKVLGNNKGNNVSSHSPRNHSVPSISNKKDNSSLSSASSDSAKVGNPEMKLKKILRKAAMPDETVIVTTINAAWTTPGSIFDLFMESFRIGIHTKQLLKHMIIIALDETAYARCKEVHPYCYVLTTKGLNFTGEAAFMSADYLALMWRRVEFLRLVLQMGYNFIFTDADVLWFRNPLSHLHPDADFQIACDYYLYNSTDKNNKPNGGFTYVKSNNRSIEFFKFWYNAREKIPGTHDQDVFNIIKHDPLFDQIGLRMRFLTTAYYGGFCQQSEDLNLVCTMHANCCVGIDHKIHDLKMLIDDWKRYMALSNEERKSKPVSFTVPRLCGPEKAKPISNLP